MALNDDFGRDIYDTGIDDRYQVSAPGYGQRFARQLRTLGHFFASVPFGGVLSFPLVGAAAVLESVSTLVSGDDGSGKKALKQVVSGTVDTVATIVTGASWWLNAPVGLVTGASIPEHARQVTNWALDSLDGLIGGSRSVDPMTQRARDQMVLGAQPAVQNSVMGGMGWSPEMTQQMDMNAAQPGGQNYFTDMVSQQRGQNPQEVRANWMRDSENRQSMRELVAAQREQEQLGIPGRQ